MSNILNFGIPKGSLEEATVGSVQEGRLADQHLVAQLFSGC